MRILFTTQPAHGHLYPLVPVAEELAAAGHEVRVATAAGFGDVVRGASLEAVPAGIDWLAGRPPRAFHDLAGTTKEGLIAEVFCGATVRPLADDVVALAETWRPDLVVRETWELGGALAASHLGVPCVVHGIGSWLNMEELVDAGGIRLRELALGDDLAWVDGALYLDPCPALLAPPTTRPRPAALQPLRTVPFGAAAASALDPEPASERPLVYVGLGTVMHRRMGVLEAILAALAEIDATFVVTTGPGRSPAALGPQPPHIHLSECLPLAELLPRCALAVCHAGWGTSMAALAYGVPMVCVPLGADGFANAAAIERSGAGVTVTATRDSQALGAAIRSVLADGRFAAAAGRVRDEIDALPPPSEAAQRIEALVTSSA
jgi:UDP:flavonoid glycosyltransferase YjiC (YdhE family)